MEEQWCNARLGDIADWMMNEYGSWVSYRGEWDRYVDPAPENGRNFCFKKAKDAVEFKLLFDNP